METLVRNLKALSDKNRLRILKLLQIKSLCVCEITEILAVSTPTISNHLSVLVDAGFLRSEKEGRWVHYHLVHSPASSEVASLLPLLQFWMNDDDQIRADRTKLKTVCKEDLCKK
ncbi:MAG TPA: metalloregulator ArsR/SmtB family transcription factor [Fibrobacteria bacterium]|nr:metalloregulator ArsR/SmtB family transcription factor [Fibrobacteria bacterium]